MAVTPLDYDDIVDFRYDPFANGGQGEFQPIGIGFASVGYGSKAAEVRQVPNSAPYVIKLYEVPYQLTASATEITKGATTFTEVSQSVTPSSNQYRVVYYDNLAMGEIQFNSAQAGEEVTIKYYGLGHTLQKISLDTRVQDSGNTTIGGIKTFSSSPVFSAGSQRGELGTALKEKIVQIGNWNMEVSGAGTDTVNVAHGLGADWTKIVAIFVMIINDNSLTESPLYRFDNAADPGLLGGGIRVVNPTNIVLECRTGGTFDSAGYNDPAFNRGHVYILYEA
jgi:hypothetical protein